MTPKKAPSLIQRAMLVDLTVRQWTAAKNDKKISDEVATQHNSDGTMGHYYKQLLGKEALQKIRNINNAAFNEHYIRTLPWQDNGGRILSSAGFFDYQERMRDWKQQYADAVDEFCDNYDEYVAEAQRRLNGMFREEDYPPTKVVRDKFAFSWRVFPIPTASDFRVQLGTEEVAQIREEIEASTQAALQEATVEVAERVKVVVSHMAERLKAYNGQREGSFRDTLVSNVRDMANLVPSLNVTNDPRLVAIQEEMENVLCAHDPQTLRVSEEAREKTAEAAEDILKRLSQFVV